MFVSGINLIIHALPIGKALQRFAFLSGNGLSHHHVAFFNVGVNISSQISVGNYLWTEITQRFLHHLASNDPEADLITHLVENVSYDVVSFKIIKRFLLLDSELWDCFISWCNQLNTNLWDTFCCTINLEWLTIRFCLFPGVTCLTDDLMIDFWSLDHSDIVYNAQKYLNYTARLCNFYLRSPNYWCYISSCKCSVDSHLKV